MSFLYQALIKDKNKPQPAASGSQAAMAAGHNSNYAQPFAESGKSTSPVLWVVIGLLLLVVGLLAGYIWGGKGSLPVVGTQLVNETAPISVPVAAIEVDAGAKKAELVSEPSSANDDALNSNTLAAENGISDEKQIEVAIDGNGKVQTQIVKAAQGLNEPKLTTLGSEATSNIASTDDTNTYNTNTYNTDTNTSAKPELPMTAIPEALKSSFAQAVKATEDNVEPGLFETHIDSASSLPLIAELPVTEQYLLPDIEYQMHIYASDKSERWIRINNKTLAEGDSFNDELMLLEIRQDQIIWQTNARRFAQNALQDFVKAL